MMINTLYPSPSENSKPNSMYGVDKENCHGVIADLCRLSFNTTDAISLLERIREYKIGVKESII